ncbi:MAG TPA: exodeoxyribonuclease VII large subunit [Syntrophorhabdaceae bacterium]|nr:exodeoxyribonuclease VII large subunit [Syntrophorhabdaceae bacterium]
MNIEHITLLELISRIKNILAREFASPTWVVSEISEIKVNNSGHCYLDLVEKKGDQIAVRVGGIIWAANYRKLSRSS